MSGQSSNESTELPGPGVSYASVLNLQRTKDANKENISQLPKASINQLKENIDNDGNCGKSYQKSKKITALNPPLNSETNHINDENNDEKIIDIERNDSGEKNIVKKEGFLNGEIGTDGEFQTVAPKSARRKEKLREHRDHRERHRNRERHQQQSSRAHSGGSKDRFKERTQDKEKDKEQEGEEIVVKYVEAPLPSVNPWSKGKNSTVPCINSVPVPVVVSEQRAEREKRVLQPQQQQTKHVGEFLFFGYIYNNIYYLKIILFQFY